MYFIKNNGDGTWTLWNAGFHLGDFNSREEAQEKAIKHYG